MLQRQTLSLKGPVPMIIIKHRPNTKVMPRNLDPKSLFVDPALLIDELYDAGLSRDAGYVNAEAHMSLWDKSLDVLDVEVELVPRFHKRLDERPADPIVRRHQSRRWRRNCRYSWKKHRMTQYRLVEIWG